MKHTFFAACVIVLTLFASSRVCAQQGDWSSPDKARHFGVSAAVFGAGYGTARVLDAGDAVAIPAALGLSLSVGIAKEWHDHTSGKGADARDIAWDVAGTAAGLFLVKLIKPKKSQTAQAVVRAAAVPPAVTAPYERERTAAVPAPCGATGFRQ